MVIIMRAENIFKKIVKSRLLVISLIIVVALTMCVTAAPMNSTPKIPNPKLPYPDLTCTNKVITILTPSYAAGSTFNGIYRVRNSGTVSSNPFEIKIEMRKPNQPSSTTPIYIGTASVSGLDANSETQGNISLTIPKITSPGNYYLYEIIDSQKRIKETNESNNICGLFSPSEIKVVSQFTKI